MCVSEARTETIDDRNYFVWFLFKLKFSYNRCGISFENNIRLGNNNINKQKKMKGSVKY